MLRSSRINGAITLRAAIHPLLLDRYKALSTSLLSIWEELGVKVALDDFGVGYSSLGYLKQLRVDNLKIDRSFIRDLVSDSNDYAIVAAIFAMARHLRIDIIVEGVEGWPQLEMLRGLGCRFAQGFLLARPTPADNCAQFLSNTPLRLHDVGNDVLATIAVGSN